LASRIERGKAARSKVPRAKLANYTIDKPTSATPSRCSTRPTRAG
jgi:hypothetical protein